MGSSKELKYSSKDRREDHAWRKCIWCGKFTSYEDMDNGKVKTSFTEDGDGGFTECEHIVCAQLHGSS